MGSVITITELAPGMCPAEVVQKDCGKAHGGCNAPGTLGPHAWVPGLACCICGTGGGGGDIESGGCNSSLELVCACTSASIVAASAAGDCFLDNVVVSGGRVTCD